MLEVYKTINPNPNPNPNLDKKLWKSKSNKIYWHYTLLHTRIYKKKEINH